MGSIAVLNQYKKRLTISLIIELLFALMAVTLMVFIAVAFATDAPNSGLGAALFSGSVVFVIFAMPLLTLPLLALWEIKNYPHKRRHLAFNYIHTLVLLVFVFIFFPVALWHFYLLRKLSSFSE